jgi:hypothetical protein
VPLFEIDLNEVPDASLPTRLATRFTGVRAGRLDGFCVSFVARFDDELRIDSSPFADDLLRPSSWPIPMLRHETVRLADGDELTFELEATELASPSTWRWHTNEQRS